MKYCILFLMSVSLCFLGCSKKNIDVNKHQNDFEIYANNIKNALSSEDISSGLIDLAWKNNPHSLFGIALHYTYVDIKPDLAFLYYRQAALGGSIPAIYYLGSCYESGLGVTKNYRTAYQCYTVAMNYGHYSAYQKIGFLLLQQSDNARLGMELLYVAADKGFLEAQLNILEYLENNNDYDTIKKLVERFNTLNNIVNENDLKRINYIFKNANINNESPVDLASNYARKFDESILYNYNFVLLEVSRSPTFLLNTNVTNKIDDLSFFAESSKNILRFISDEFLCTILHPHGLPDIQKFERNNIYIETFLKELYEPANYGCQKIDSFYVIYPVKYDISIEEIMKVLPE